jgi:LAS superfamily LD-carboxypeptidase LdcB
MKQLIVLLMLLLSIYSCKKKVKSVNHVLKFNASLGQLEIKNVDDYQNAKAFVLGKFNYKEDIWFTKVSSRHSAKVLYLEKDVYIAFMNMQERAAKDGVKLKILSGTRNFSEQKAIWERKWKTYQNLEPLKRSQKILEYSSMPSTSRHHWGTDIDINSLSNLYFSSGSGKKEYDWLKTNANKFGFYQAYTNKDNGRTGYNLENWHWSYLPLASKYLSFYNYNINYKDIKGFKGDSLALTNNMINDYVNGLSKKIIAYN